ncbi:MAG: hypothetical protein HOP11_12865 [Saprospiraceae bacterium]|nr:hypothetical protein [Saprospiraceae bacterium]
MKVLYPLLIALVFSQFLLSQVRFIATTDVKQVFTGSSFDVEFRLENAEGRQFQEPDFGGLKKIGGSGRSMSTTIINGSMSSSTGYTYTLVGLSPGKYTIGPASISVSQKVYKSNPLTIEVIKQNSSTSKGGRDFSNSTAEVDGDVFIEVSANQNKVYPGQQVFLTTKLFTQVGINHIEAIESSFPQNCEIENIGGDYPVQREIIKGKEYLTKVLNNVAIYPLSSGKIILPRRVYRIILGDDHFGFGLKSLFFETAKVIESNSLTIEVFPLPSPIPENFSGAVGNFSAEFSRLNSSYSLSDALQIILTIEGNGNFKIINPKIQINDSLIDIVNPSSSGSQKIKDLTEIIKKQSYSFLLTPKNTGVLNLNNAFCYFDPSQKKYIQIQDSQTINIIKSNSGNKDHIVKPMPIYTDLDNDYNQRYNKFFSIALFLLPFILGFFMNQGIGNFQTNFSSFLLSAKNKKEQVITNSTSPEELILSYCKKRIPDSAHCNSLFEMKNYLSSNTENSLSGKLVQLINEYQVYNYMPTKDPETLQQIISKFKSL